jgi:DNA-binding response OmpR family regulator
MLGEFVSLRNVLVVDDDPAVLELLTSVLQREDRHVVGAYDGRTALEEIARFRYDLVVAGGRNGLDGLELLRRMRQVRPDTPVIVTAEQQDPARVLRAMRERAYSYFHKPLPPGGVADMVRQALEASGWQHDIEVLSARPEWTTLAVRCKMEAGERMVQFLREATADLPPAPREDIATAFRELLMNSIEHGGRSDPNQSVRVSLIRTRRAFLGQLQDPGDGFSLETIPHAAVGNPADSPIRHVEIRAEQGQRPGGFGILMTRSLVDELVYNERGNEVLFVKYLD